MKILNPYKELFETKYSFYTSVAKILVRLSAASIALILILMISQQTGSFALAGLIAGYYSFSIAFGAPIISLLCDKFAVKNIVLIAGLLNCLLLAIFSIYNLPAIILVITVILAGFFEAPIDGIMRKIWDNIFEDDFNKRMFAQSWETMLISLLYVISPLIISLCLFFFSATIVL